MHKIGFKYSTDESNNVITCNDQPENNRYVTSVLEAVHDFITEEANGACFSELRLQKKIEACRVLFNEDRNKLILKGVRHV